MLDRPPREREWVSWLSVGFWSLIVFVTVPLARNLQGFVSEHLGRPAFAYLVIAVTLLWVGVALAYSFRQRSIRVSGGIWLLAVSAVFIGYTIELRTAPEEAVHFIEYGLLGLLTYRALSHRVRDAGIYFAAVIIAGIVGTVDEAIQWATPLRVWDLRDIGLNVFAASLAQVAIAKGLRPRIVSGWPTAHSLHLVCRLATTGLLLLGASLLNTPDRIAWYADRVPLLEYLKETGSPMFEYGHLHHHPDIGRFRSRFSIEELYRIDAERGEEAARILDRFSDPASYSSFLQRYTPISDPFVHEARVHLYSRDYHLEAAERNRDSREQYRFHLSVAFCENRIMEQYFPRTLRNSSYRFSPQRRGYLREQRLPDLDRESWVSRNLATRVNEREVATVLVLALLGLAIGERYSGRKRAHQKGDA
jgi:VanZ family protein